MNLPDNWTISQLPSLLKFMKSGGTPNTSRNDYYGGEIPFVAIDDMTSSFKYLNGTSKTITKNGLKNSNAWLVPEYSILYSIYATLGVTRINKIPVATNQAILAFINDPGKINVDYLYYWLSFIRDSVINLSSQTTQSNLSATVVKTFEVVHPLSLSEQSKIAEVLSKVDQAIEQTESLIAKQQRIKTGLMQDLLTRGIDENGNLRSEETHTFKDSPLWRIPVEWKVEPLAKVTEKLITYGIVQPGPNLPTGVPFIQTKDLTKGELQTEEMDRTSQDIHNSYSRSAVCPGDVIIGIRASVGLVCQVPSNTDQLNISRGVARLSPAAHMEGRYLYWVLQSIKIQNSIKIEIKGTTYPEITLPALRNIIISVPSLKEQRNVSTLINKQFSTIRKLVELHNKLHSLKTALMQDLLTGKKRVTPLLEKTEVHS